MVDQRGLSGQFILTGSAVPLDNAVQHTGTGRISRLTMRTMSLFESGESNGTVSLSELFDGKKEIEAISDLTIEQIAFAIVRGGWPASVTDASQNAMRHAIDYVEAIINADISRVDNIEKNPVRVRALLRSLARNISTLATTKTIRDDIAMGDGDGLISEKTIGQYINALNRIFVTDNIPAWNPLLRSKTAIRTSSKRQFTDPSIAAAVIALNDGRWAAIEIKLGTKEIEEAAKHLLALKQRVNTQKMREPAFLMIITGEGFAYQRKDGVFVVPVGCLRN